MPKKPIRKGGKQLFVFNLDVLDNDKRLVSGLATGPQLDRENESILKEAVEKALPNFMHLPIIHLNHTERPVGLVKKAEFKGQNLHIEAQIKSSSDCDKLWRDIVKASQMGEPYQFSIYGDRLDCTDSCSVDPEKRTEPCITKALEMYSISICDPGTAIWSNSYAEVMKALDLVDLTSQSLSKATDSVSSNLIHPTTDGKYPKKGVIKTMPKPPEEEMEPKGKPVPPEGEPAEGKPETKAPTTEAPEEAPVAEGGDGPEGGSEIKNLLTQIVELLQTLQTGPGLNKAAPEKEEEEEEEKDNKMEEKVEKCPCKKAEEKEDPIQKANLELKKATEKIATLEAELETIRKSTAKGPELVVIDPEAAGAASQSFEKSVHGNIGRISRLINR